MGQQAITFDLASHGDAPLLGMRADIASDRSLIAALAQAHAKLGAAAVNRACEGDAQAEAKALRSAILAWDQQAAAAAWSQR